MFHGLSIDTPLWISGLEYTGIADGEGKGEGSGSESESSAGLQHVVRSWCYAAKSVCSPGWESAVAEWASGRGEVRVDSQEKEINEGG